MEHLSLPTQSGSISIIVPCLLRNRYDGGPFESYLERVDWTEERILSCHLEGQVPELAISHLQTWLFFGTLNDLATFIDGSTPIKSPLPHLFVCTHDDGLKVITTRHLGSFWSQIESELNARSNDDQDLYRQKMIHILRRSNLLVSNIKHSNFTQPHQAVILSIMLLNEFLMGAADLQELEDQRPYFRSHLLESVMRERGWCPSDVDRLRLDLDITALLFTLHCGAPPCRKSHEQCTYMMCNARQILDSEEYLTKHDASTACNCNHISVDQHVLLESLNQEVIPVTIFNSSSHPPGLETLKSNQVSRYVAVSHVWSDLRGNRSANALPQCTLRSLQDRVNKLYEPSNSSIPFWIDTLSCPIEPESATEQAIALMRETYANADKVLVLDSYLEQMNSQTMTEFEKALRIICTGWTRRLWTLQEGVLAKTIYFQFADKAVDGDEVFMRLAEPPISYTKIPIFHSWLEIRLNWNGKFDSSITGSEFVWMLYRALRFRTTSVSTDEPLCLSTLTGVELKTILEEEKEDRMKRFWELIPKVDTSLLYWNGPRLNVPGLRWAPASLLGASPEAILASSAKQIREAKEAIRIPSGLVLTSPGILLGKWTTSIRKGFWLRYEKDVWYHVGLINDVGLPRVQPGDTDVVRQFKVQDGNSMAPQVLALLTHAPLQQCFEDDDFQVGEQPPSCALISIYGSNDDLLFASCESVGVIRPFKMDDSGLPIDFPVSALANFVGREAHISMVETLQSTPEVSEDMRADHHLLHDSLEETRASTDEQARSSGNLNIESILQDDSLNLVFSDRHAIFYGTDIPSTQRFCIG